MDNKKIYISGAIAHYDMEERKAAFSAAATYLRVQGYEPVNPFDNGLPQPGDWREHMRVDIGMLLECQYTLHAERLVGEQGCEVGTGRGHLLRTEASV